MPLPLMLQLAAMNYLTSIDASRRWSGASPSLNSPSPAGLNDPKNRRLKQKLAQSVEEEARSRLSHMLKGVEQFTHQVPETRPQLAGDVIWQAGAATLYDYGTPRKADAPVVLTIPSLINRSYILDMGPRKSLMRHLKGAGLHSYLLDWGEPSAEAKPLSLEEYVLDRLEPALDYLFMKHRRPVRVVGYCMGGLFAMALAARQPHKVERLALLATPWDFERAGYAAGAPAKHALETLFQSVDEIPAEAVHAWFYLQRPFAVHDKFARFSDYEPGSAKHKQFLAIEQWLQDGVALSAPAARECFVRWALDNQPAKGEWNVGGKTVMLADITTPAFVAIAARDTVVPAASSESLAGLPNATLHRVAAGHVSMVAGAKARDLLWNPLANWLKA